MIRIINLFILISMAFSTNVTFNVDMSQEDVGQEYPTLWMGYFYPDAGFAMTDSDGDNVWSITLDLEPGTYTYKFRNGAWTEWNTGSGWEDMLGQDCAVGQYSDREVVVGAANLVLETVCFGSCTSECLTYNYFDVTFNVNMSNVEDFVPSDGVFLNGTVNSWCGSCNPMSDDNGDDIYSLTISLSEGEYEFIYTTNGWDGLNGAPPLGSSCDYLQGDEFANYGFNLSGANLNLPAVNFGECEGDNGGGTGSGTVSFSFDGLDECSFVSVSGTFDGWSGWGATTDTDLQAQVTAGEHEFQVLCVDTNVPEWYNDIWGASTIFTAPLGSSCDFNIGDEFNNYGFSIVDGEQKTVAYCAGSCTETCECPSLGDINADGGFNVLDIVALANCVLNGNCSDAENSCAADLNGDGGFNVLDIVSLANCVLNGNCGGRVDDASYSKLMIDNEKVSIHADGFIGGVQMTIVHNLDFQIEMTQKALLAEYITNNYETRLLVINPQTSDLFTFSGEFEIKEIIAANTQNEIVVDMPINRTYTLVESFPNPFNPSTNIMLTLPFSANVKVEIHDILGQLVETLASGYMVANTYTFEWNASDFSSGVYFIKTEINHSITMQKIMLLK